MTRSPRRRRRAAASLAALLAVLAVVAAGGLAAGRGLVRGDSDRPSAARQASTHPTAGAPYPDAGSTGVRSPRARLRAVPGDLRSGPGWRWDPTAGCIEVEGARSTLARLDVTGCIEVLDGADGTTITDSRVTTSGRWWAIGARGAQDVTISDVSISGGGRLLEVGIKDVTGSSSLYVRRVDISDWTTGVQMSRGDLVDSYIHSPASPEDVAAGGFHVNGVTDNGGRTDGSLLIQHNTVLNDLEQTDAISLFTDFGPVRNVTVHDNLVAGGSYTLYSGGGDPARPPSNVRITDNRFSTRYRAQGGAFGPATCLDGPTNTWSGNTWHDGPRAGQTISPACR